MCHGGHRGGGEDEEEVERRECGEGGYHDTCQCPHATEHREIK